MDIKDCGLFDEIFSIQNLPEYGGELQHYNATQLRTWAYKNLDKVIDTNIPLHKSFIDMILRDRGIEEHKIPKIPPHLLE